MSFLELLIRLDQHLFKLVYTGLRPDDAWIRTQIDHFMLVANTLGENMVYPVVLVALWFSAAQRPRLFLSRALIITVAIVIAAGAAGAIKSTTDRSRPAWVFLEPSLEQHDGILPAWRYASSDESTPPEWFSESFGYRLELDNPWGPLLRPHSFPSGHAFFAFAIAVALAAYFPMLKGWLLGFASLSALSRTYGGHHFVFDLLAGAWVAFVGVLIVLWAIRRLVRWRASRVGPAPAWVNWLAEGLPPEPPAGQAPKRWARRVALCLAIPLYPVAIVALVMLQLPVAWLAGPLAVLAYVVGSRRLEQALARRITQPDAGGPAAKAEPTHTSPVSTWPNKVSTTLASNLPSTGTGTGTPRS